MYGAADALFVNNTSIENLVLSPGAPSVQRYV